MRYKCLECCLIIDEGDLNDGCCPVCHDEKRLKKMCELDVDHCGHTDMQTIIKLCEKCGEVVCPQCNSHLTHFGVSRVTGYLAEVSGWSEGKRIELAQRVHYDIT